MISEKLNSTLRLQVGSLDEVDYLITELLADNELLEKYHNTVKQIL
ncbi:MAG: hypothetical protein H7339_04080 [Arcicella sp.]|nr:hypothetical protein [Arcicella sp.]